MSQIERSSIEQVKEFHEVFGHPVANKVGEETLETRQLRIKLLFEELKELAEASDCRRTFQTLCDRNDLDYRDDWGVIQEYCVDGDNVDHVEELDALCDLQVVLDGKFLTSGHWKVKEQAFAEVHRSNMSKSSNSNRIKADEVVDHCMQLQKDGKGTNILADSRYGRTIWRREDGKILKGPDFSEPNLKQFVKVYYWYSDAKDYFITTTPFVEEEKGLRSSTYDEYKQNR